MNTKGIKFLAVLAVLAMAFAAFAVISTGNDSDAEAATPGSDAVPLLDTTLAYTVYQSKNSDMEFTVSGTTELTATFTGYAKQVVGPEQVVNDGGVLTAAELYPTWDFKANNYAYIWFLHPYAFEANKLVIETNVAQAGYEQEGSVWKKTVTVGETTDNAMVIMFGVAQTYKLTYTDGEGDHVLNLDFTGVKIGDAITTGEKGETYTFTSVDFDLKYASGAVTGTTLNNATTNPDFARDEFKALGYASIIINGMTSKVTDAKSVVITQKNSALVSVTFDDGATDASKMTRTKTYAIAGDAFSDNTNAYNILVPQDGSAVELSFAYYDNVNPKATGAKLITTTSFSIDFSGAYTQVVNIDASTKDIKGVGYEWTDSTQILVLSNYDGNAVFGGAIKQVTLSGDNEITAKNVPYGIYSSIDMKIKPVEGTGSLTISLDDSYDVLFGIRVTTGIIAKGLTIEGAGVAIVIDSVDETDAFVGGIYADKLTVYESSIAIALDASKTSYAIDTNGPIDIKSSGAITLSAQYGIIAIDEDDNPDVPQSIDIAASNILITSAVNGLVASQVTVTKETVLTVSSQIAIPSNNAPVCGMVVGALTAESDSIVTVDDLRLCEGASTNNATVNVAGYLVIDDGATLNNKSAFNVAGMTMVIGTLDNQAGEFNALGKVIVSEMKNEPKGGADVKFPAGDGIYFVKGVATATTEYYVKEIDIVALQLNPDMTAWVKVNVVFALAETGVAIGPKTAYGTATLDADGKIIAMSFTVETYDLLTDTTYQAPVSVVWQSYSDTSVNPAVTKYKYVVDANGEIFVDGAKKTVIPSKLEGLEKNGGTAMLNGGAVSKFTVTGGKFVAEAGLDVNTAQDKLVSGGNLLAGLTLKKAVVFDKGTFAGSMKLAKAIEAPAVAVTISKDATVVGGIELAKAGNIDIAGTLEGTILADDVASTISITGKVIGAVSIEGKYKSSSTVEEPDTPYTATISLLIQNKSDGAATVIATEAANATTPGFVKTTRAGDVAKDKTSGIIVTEGTFQFEFGIAPANVIPSSFDFKAEAGTTVNIKSSTTVDVKGAIIIDDGATFNYYDSVKKVYNYGKIDNEITFAVAPNTYYCSFEYALGSAPEGTPLEVTKDVVIDKDVAIKKDVVVTIASGKTVTFTTKSLSMSEGAGFVLQDGSAVNFGITGANKTVSGLFTYGLNAISLADVVFDTASSITATKASGSAATDKITVNIAGYNAGAITVTLGDVAGSVVFKDVGDAGKETTGGFTIGALASYSGTFTYDAAKKAKIVNNGEYAPTVDVPAIDVEWSGAGYIALAEGKKISFAAVDPTAAKFIKQNVKIMFDDNSVMMEDVYSADVITISAVKGTTTVPAHFLIADNNGKLYGDYTFEGNVEFGTVELAEKGTIFGEADSVISITAAKTFTATGLLEVGGTINKKTETVTTYGTLSYQVEYMDGLYTVYTQLGTAITEGGVTDMTISDNITLNGGTAAAPKNLGDVTLEVVDGKKLTVNGYVTIGTAATSLGALYGIDGNVVIADGGVLIVYDSATVDADNIFTDNDMTVKAKKSVFFIEINDVVYATAYNDGTANLNNVEQSLNPSIEGYRFTGYMNYVPGKTHVGETDVAIMLEAEKVTVILTKAEGLTYYVNNIAVMQTGVPLDLRVGAVVSATIDPGYTGVAKVNGQDYVVVDVDTKTITATGAQPIPEPEPTPTPTPEPEVDGLKLTDILLIVLVVLIAIMVVILVLRLNRS